jgi:hypothetical protein
MADYGFDERTASMLMGQAVEYELANVVDPHFTIVARLRNTYLPRHSADNHAEKKATLPRG